MISTLRRWLLSGDLPPASLEVADAARRCGLAGLLDSAVAGTWPDDDAARQVLHNAHLRLLVRATHQLQIAAEVLEVLAAKGLRSLPLKGAAVAESLYESVGHRPMEDVDILALDDWGASVAALESAGFVVTERVDHATVFARGPIVLELHRGLTSCPRLHPIDADGLWQRSRLRSGKQVERAPSDEDLLVQGALHAAFQHGLDISPVQFLDLRRLLESAVDGERLLEIADAARARRALACALLAAEASVGAAIPGHLRPALVSALPRRLLRSLESHRAALERGADSALRVSLARLRWSLAEGQRAMLIRETFAPEVPGIPARPGRVLRRLLHILGRRAFASPRRGH